MWKGLGEPFLGVLPLGRVKAWRVFREITCQPPRHGIGKIHEFHSCSFPSYGVVINKGFIQLFVRLQLANRH